LVIPSMVRMPAVLAVRTQDPVRVKVTVWPVVKPVGVAVHVPVNPFPKVTVGAGGTPNPGANVTEMVSPEARPPAADVVNPTPQDESAPVKVEPGVKVTALGEEPMTTGAAGWAAVMSWDVATLKPLAG
jgi:hypothetical protein